MNETLPQDSYKSQLKEWQTRFTQLQQRRKNLGLLRLAVFVVTIILVYIVFTTYGVIGVVPTIAGLGALLYLVSVDVANNSRIKNAQTLIQINEDELQALEHRFLHREDG
ncbi:MAG: hypothetical protein EOO10_22875, partial [Chitinophagaceae bacterium]